MRPRGLNMILTLFASLALSIAVAGPNRVPPIPNEVAGRDGNWARVGGLSNEWHFSPLSGIDDSNVGRLGLAWSFEFDTNRGQEASPVIVDGVMFVTSAWSKVFALNATTGTLLWSFDPKVPGANAFTSCCDVVNRGVAISNGRVFVGTIDGRLVALDERDGKVIWTRLTVDPNQPYAITGAPRVFRNKVIIGNAGGEFGVRGYVTAYDVTSGARLWRFYTVPGKPGAKSDGAASDSALAKIAGPTWFGHWYDYGGGGAVWDTIVFDAQFNQIVIGVGNGTPWDRRVRSDGKGDNLFLASIVALDADTGVYRWHYQESPGDSWDFDATQNMILAYQTVHGRAMPVLMQASKNGFFYVINRRSGKLVSAKNFVPQNWTDGIDHDTGRPKMSDEIFYAKTRLIMPSGTGGHSWQPMSFNPATGLVYIPAMEVPWHLSPDDHFKFRQGEGNTAIDPKVFLPPEDEAARKALRAMLKGELIAWDPIAQKERWRVSHDGFWNGGVLSTAGNLVFQGQGRGSFEAYRADNGAMAWTFSTQSGVMAAPVSYRVGDIQYIAVLSGWGGVRVGSSQGDSQRPAPPGRVLVFKLDGQGALPAVKPADPAPANPARDPFTQSQVASGADLYSRNCAGCHGQAVYGGDVIPDLRRANALSDRTLWRTIVLDGALQSAGMIGFRRFLTADDVESIRAYVSHQAQLLRDATARHPVT
jgi:quinohemoprotein ethanol dehydrogenase